MISPHERLLMQALNYSKSRLDGSKRVSTKEIWSSKPSFAVIDIE